MTKPELSNEEKRCLQMWFRQAIAQAELKEVTSTIIRRHRVSQSAKHKDPVNHHSKHQINHQPIHKQELVVG